MKQSCFLIKDDGTLEKLDKLPEGAKQIHFGIMDNAFRPRGTLQKNSLSSYLYEKLVGEFKYWTDPKYEDRKEAKEVIEQLKKNLCEEVNAAFDKFLNNFCK